MSQLVHTGAVETRARGGASIWKTPASWVIEKKLGREFWIFFAVAFFFDFGFAVYFFLFNLFLLDCHFDERTIGLVAGSLTLGSVAGTLPAGWVARRAGVRPLLIGCLILAPLLGLARTLAMWEAAQIGLAFLAGMAMCTWGVCYLPAVARLTTEENRASAFSLIFSVSIGTSALGGMACGFLPHWLKMAGFQMQASEIERLILMTSCGIALLGLIPAMLLLLPVQKAEPQTPPKELLRRFKINPFLLRFVPSMALWTAVVASFTPFANVFLSRDLHVSLSRIGFIFSAAQVVQLCMGLLTPLIFRSLGLVNGIVATQLATAATLACLALTQNSPMAIGLYLAFSAAQWMSSPGLYNLLMSRVPDRERSTASAMTLFCNALMQSFATVAAGLLFAQFGYPRVLAGIAALALTAALLFRTLVAPADRRAPG